MIPSAVCPSSRMSYELRQELRKGQGASWLLVDEYTLPGVTKKYAFGPALNDRASSNPLGQYFGAALEVSGPARSTDRAGNLPDVIAEATLDDSDNALSAILEGASSRMVPGSVAVRRLGSLAVPSACWMEVFRGIVESYERPAPRRWKLYLRPNDIPLRYTHVPVPVIDASDWPNAPTGSLAQYGPLLYGRHDSAGTSATGAIPLVKVSGTDKQYLVCWGWAKSIDAVYADSVRKTPVTDWSSGHFTMNSGRVATVIAFTADQGDKAITADVQGYETVGDGSGTLIENPIDILAHFLTNWIYNDYKSGSWFASSTAPLDTALLSVTATQFSRAPAARRIFGEQTLARDLVSELARSLKVRLFWTNAGKIAARAVVAQQLGVYTDEGLFLRSDSRGFPAPTVSPDWESVVDRINVDALYGEADGKYYRSLQVRDPTMTREAADSLQLPWSAAYYY